MLMPSTIEKKMTESIFVSDAPSTLKRSSLNLDLYLWTTLPDLCAQAAATVLLAAPVLEHTPKENP